MLACKEKSCAKKRGSWISLLERRLAGRKFPEGLRAKPLAALECLFAGAGGLPFLLHVMPVSMRVAEFDEAGKRKTNYEAKEGNDAISKLDPSKPVWVVVHGRENSEDSSQIAALTRNLQNLDVQVVTIDWEGGAKDGIGLGGQKWIEQVGIWASRQLQAAGFKGEQINVIGHSWGSYVSYEIGAHIPGGVRTLVGLDPAEDAPILGGGIYKGFNDPNFKFSDVAGNSYTIYSSNLGSPDRAKTAEYSFEIKAKEGYEQERLLGTGLQNMAHDYWSGGIIADTRDDIVDALREHGFAASLFSELMLRNKLNPNDPTASIFSTANMQSDRDEVRKQEGFEGVFFVDPSLTTNDIGTEKGKNVWVATTFGFSAKDRLGNDILNPRTL